MRSSYSVMFCWIQGPLDGNLGPKIETWPPVAIMKPCTLPIGYACPQRGLHARMRSSGRWSLWPAAVGWACRRVATLNAGRLCAGQVRLGSPLVALDCLEAAVAAPHACGTALVRGDRSDRSPAGFVHVGKGLIDDRHSLAMAAGRTLLGEGLSDLFGWFREEL